MKRQHLRTILNYALFQSVDLALFFLALLFLQKWLDLSNLLVVLLIAAWIVKDILLFPLLRRAYEVRSPEDAHPMIGARGTARDRIDPSGYAWFMGELWRVEVVESGRPIEKGEPLRVRKAQGVTLLVTRDEADEEQDTCSRHC